MGTYVPNRPEDRQKMLAALGLEAEAQLFTDIPEALRLNHPLNIPPGRSELAVSRVMEELAGKNKVFKTIFRGAGAYKHFIPAAARHAAARSEFVTAYTPYQAEISQGVLQAIFEFQTMICELTGMDASNASAYDGATAAAEAALMCRGRGRNKVVVSGCAPADIINTIRTYAEAVGMTVAVTSAETGATEAADLETHLGGETACVYLHQPNFFGVIEDARAIAEAAHASGAKLVMGVNPLAAAVLKSPGECGADIAVGEGQPLGLGLAFGGPYLGFMACKKELTRTLPGRIVGETTDRRGERAFVLTLQAREQHIRREKAGSNICSNQALCALAASAYMAALGPAGLAQTARLMYNNAHYLQDRLCALPGFALCFEKPFFHEFAATCPVPAAALNARLEQDDILGGYELTGGLKNDILWCATEINTKEEIDRLVDIITRFTAEEGGR